MNIQLQANNIVLLAQIENKGLTVETHCRSGFCGMCRVRLIEGQVAYEETPSHLSKKGKCWFAALKQKPM